MVDIDPSNTQALIDEIFKLRTELMEYRSNYKYKFLLEEVEWLRDIIRDGFKNQAKLRARINELSDKIIISNHSIACSKMENSKVDKEHSLPTNGVIELPQEISAIGLSHLKSNLLGYFIHKALPFGMVKDLANTLWADKGLLKVTNSEKGLYEFHFSTTEQCTIILEEGPWFFTNKHIVLNHWKPDFQRAMHVTILVWIKLFGLPLNFWTKPGLSHISSFIGVPLFADPITEKKQKTQFAKVCVEIDASFDFPSVLKLHQSSGNITNVIVDYQYKPVVCYVYKCFGHSARTCHSSTPPLKNLQPSSEWKVIPFKSPHKNT
ncbi:uncharacterized protein LOC132277805 [Cornus florida]|uniref:uncharacterized protein LOC132277805 n=1 Tax=Cornus florida TaxID=4283 RepID=UPI0028A07FE4|nr:uncharacterized protein LOC132277805 [Cornus florida]